MLTNNIVKKQKYNRVGNNFLFVNQILLSNGNSDLDDGSWLENSNIS